jgi:hypothetical protein
MAETARRSVLLCQPNVPIGRASRSRGLGGKGAKKPAHWRRLALGPRPAHKLTRGFVSWRRSPPVPQKPCWCSPQHPSENMRPWAGLDQSGKLLRAAAVVGLVSARHAQPCVAAAILYGRWLASTPVRPSPGPTLARPAPRQKGSARSASIRPPHSRHLSAPLVRSRCGLTLQFFPT